MTRTVSEHETNKMANAPAQPVGAAPAPVLSYASVAGAALADPVSVGAAVLRSVAGGARNRADDPRRLVRPELHRRDVRGVRAAPSWGSSG
jgi:hypothetical protein